MVAVWEHMSKLLGARAQRECLVGEGDPALWPPSLSLTGVPTAVTSVGEGGGPHNSAGKFSPGCLCFSFSFLLREPPRIF